MSLFRRFTSRPAAQRHHGLQNQGATCYLNSVLQVFFMTRDFRESVKRNGGKGKSFQSDLKKLFERLEKEESNTRSITESLGIPSGWRQGDAAECFEKILNSLKNEEASQIFKISLTHKNVCVRCRNKTNLDQQFWHLPIELADCEYGIFKVVDGIEKFFSVSEVTGEDKLYCEDCEEKTDSYDKFEMKNHPEVLTLLLKRFKFDRYSRNYMKIQRSVEIPNTITVQGQKYELYAFVEHSGELKGGHYIVLIKCDEKWYEFNDTFVNLRHYDPLQLDPSFGSRGAYLLFYRKEKQTSPGAEASAPAGFTRGTSVDNDQSGNTVEEQTGDRGNEPGSEGNSVTEDEERAKLTCSTTSDRNYRKHNREAKQEAKSKKSFHKDKADFNSSRHIGREVKDGISGQSYGPEGHMTRTQQNSRGEETHSHKAKVNMTSHVDPCLQHCDSTMTQRRESERDERAAREHMQWKRETGVRDPVDEISSSNATGIQSLSGSLNNMNLGDSASTKTTDKSTPTVHVNVTLDPLGRNTVDFDRQSQYGVTRLHVNGQSVEGIIQKDIHSNTYIFTPTKAVGSPGSEPTFAENIRILPLPTTCPSHTAPYPHVHHQDSNTSGGSVISTLYYFLPCRRNTGQNSE